MKPQISHNSQGWIATDSKGKEGKSTFAEGKDKAVERLNEPSKPTTSKKKSKKKVGKRKGVGGKNL